jgi:hypothetical protein
MEKAMAQIQHSRLADPVKYLPLHFADKTDPPTHAAPPIKGGMKSHGTAAGRYEEAAVGETDMPGERLVYVLVRDGSQEETPVFTANGKADAIMVFSSREMATLYLQVANWDGHRLRGLSPRELSQWVTTLGRDHIRFIIVDANRHHQVHGGKAAPAMDLQTLHDLSGENLYQEIRSFGNG